MLFCECNGLVNIKYAGTEAQWNAIEKGENWDTYWDNYTDSYKKLDYTITYNYTGE